MTKYITIFDEVKTLVNSIPVLTYNVRVARDRRDKKPRHNYTTPDRILAVKLAYSIHTTKKTANLEFITTNK